MHAPFRGPWPGAASQARPGGRGGQRRAPRVTLLTVWRRGPRQGTDTGQITLPVPYLRGTPVSARVLYPRDSGAEVSWEASPGMLTVTLARLPSACVLRLA